MSSNLNSRLKMADFVITIVISILCETEAFNWTQFPNPGGVRSHDMVSPAIVIWTVVGVLLCIVLVLCCKCFCEGAQPQSGEEAEPPVDDFVEPAAVEPVGPVEAHEVVSLSVIASFPMTTWKPDISVGFGANGCLICMEEFVGGDLLRVLSICGHMFHVQCIGSWLNKMASSCPVCRHSYL